jgi:hypothetical protein
MSNGHTHGAEYGQVVAMALNAMEFNQSEHLNLPGMQRMEL